MGVLLGFRTSASKITSKWMREKNNVVKYSKCVLLILLISQIGLRDKVISENIFFVVPKVFQVINFR